MLFLSHEIQAQQNSGNDARVYDPNKSQEVQRKSVQTPFGPGIPEGNFGYFVNENAENDTENTTDVNQQQFISQDSKVETLNNALLFLQQLQALVNANQNVSNGEVLIDQIAQSIQRLGEQPRLQDKIAKLHGVYKNNPQAAQELIVSIMTDVRNLLQVELQQQNTMPMNNMGFYSKRNEKNMKKTANLKEVVRQHFNNFAVSDIQIISKLQFLNSMLNKEGSPPEEPREYTRPQVDKESEHFSKLHGTGGVGEEMTVADIKGEISDLEDVLKYRGYTDDEIDEVVTVVNENQRSQIDITDEDDIGSRESKGFSDKEEERLEGIIQGDEQVVASKFYFSKKAQNKFIGDYDLQREGNHFIVKRDDGLPLNAKTKDHNEENFDFYVESDEERIENILERKGFKNVFIDFTDKNSEGYYTVYVEDPDKQEIPEDFHISQSKEKMQKIAALPGMTVGPTTGGMVWCPKTKEPIEEYLCWNVCRDGIKTGEKVVCGKRVFDAMVSDNNERALNRTSVFPQNKEDAIIAGPNYRLSDDVRRSELRDIEIPTERRLQELHTTFPTHDNTREWNHTPTLSDDKEHDWSQDVKLSKKAQEKFNKQAQDMFGDYLNSLDVNENDEDYKNIIRKVVASIPVDVSEGTVPPKDVLDAVDRAVDIIRDYFGNSDQAYGFLLSTLGDMVFRYIDDDLGRQILYVVYSQYPELESFVKSAYKKSRMKKEAQFSEEEWQVMEDRRKQMAKGSDESYIDYAERIMSIIQEEGMGGRGWTGSEAASALAGAIPYPTDKQFIPTIHKIRQFLESNFGKDAMFNLGAMWVGDYWDTSRISTNLTARRHIKNHFPEVIRLYTEFHPDYPDKKEYDEEDKKVLDRIYGEFPPISNPDQYLKV